MRVTLDWDTAKDRAENEDAAKRISGDWQLRQSSGGDGFHFIAYDAVNSTRNTYENLLGIGTSGPGIRERLGDDPKRVSLDRQRWEIGSPFQQVLYSRKYMNRGDEPPFSTGNTSTHLSGVKHVQEEERIKTEDGELDYRKALDLTLEDKGWTAAELGRELGTQTNPGIYGAESGGRSASTIRRYLRGEQPVTSDAIRRWTRRNARSRGIGHYGRTDKGGESLDRDDRSGVHYTDAEDTRRTIVEYIDAPWDDKVGEDGRLYRLCQVETGSFNTNHTTLQLHIAHEKAVRRVVDALSPTSPINDVTLNLDRDLRSSWTGDQLRHPDSKHYEAEVLDPGEPEVYTGNLPNRDRVMGDARNHIITEVLLWDDLGGSIEWHVLIVDDGDNWTNHTVLKDTNGWW